MGELISLKSNQDIIAICTNCGSQDWNIHLYEPEPNKQAIRFIECSNCGIMEETKLVLEKEI